MKTKLRKNILLIISFLILISIIGFASYSYYISEIFGNESESTVAINGGSLIIKYQNNSSNITASNIYPGWSMTKNFTVSCDVNYNDVYITNFKTWYDMLLIIERNDFLTGSLEYLLEPQESDKNKDGIYAGGSYFGLPTGTNESGISMGSAYFLNSSVSHTYVLSIKYVEQENIDQYSENNAIFNARINIQSSNLVTLDVDLNGGSFIGNVLNSENKVKVPMNSNIYLTTPIKAGYDFAGWEIIEGNGGSQENLIITDENDLKVKALWKNSVVNYDYINDVQEFIADATGYYKLQIWAAQGGTSHYFYEQDYYTKGAYGGFSEGVVNLQSGDKLFIYVGGKGGDATTSIGGNGGFNGGGTGGTGAGTVDPRFYSGGGGGGGASHISNVSGTLSELSTSVNNILIVAGGGGGAAGLNDRELVLGSSGGGFNGAKGYLTVYTSIYVLGGNQSSGYAFGLGQSGLSDPNPKNSWGQGGAGGGGGGFYGGYTGIATNKNSSLDGAGGSGYIGNSLLTDKFMYCYNCDISDEETTKTYSTSCAKEEPTPNCAKKGNGYVRITFLHS